MQCEIEGCGRDRYQSHRMCGSHYMKWWRYGDPHYRAPSKAIDIAGQRFGTLTAANRTDQGKWECRCDCGGRRLVTFGELKRGTALGRVTCGDKRQHWPVPATYTLAHQRVRAERGQARSYPCVDCGGTARHWSYDRADPDERSSKLGPWSADVQHYEPRCVKCHKRFDLDAIRKESPDAFSA